jgi:response regulator RpfG family c-di-GMP phosphodiesterase
MDNSHTNGSNLEIFSIIWLDPSVNSNRANQNAEQQLRNIINHLRKFEDGQECQQYIEERSQEDRLILIVSDQFGKDIVPQIHHLRQVSSIYVYCPDKQKNQEWVSQFNKVRLF